MTPVFFGCFLKADKSDGPASLCSLTDLHKRWNHASGSGSRSPGFTTSFSQLWLRKHFMVFNDAHLLFTVCCKMHLCFSHI